MSMLFHVYQDDGRWFWRDLKFRYECNCQASRGACRVMSKSYPKWQNFQFTRNHDGFFFLHTLPLTSISIIVSRFMLKYLHFFVKKCSVYLLYLQHWHCNVWLKMTQKLTSKCQKDLMKTWKCIERLCENDTAKPLWAWKQMEKYSNVPKFSDRQVWKNSVDPDQTAPRGAVWSGSTLFAISSASFGKSIRVKFKDTCNYSIFFGCPNF